jgi:hypothetical protein
LRPLYAELDFALVVTRSVPVRVAENIDGAYRRAGRMVARGDGLCELRKLRLLSWWKRRYRVLIAWKAVYRCRALRDAIGWW